MQRQRQYTTCTDVQLNLARRLDELLHGVAGRSRSEPSPCYPNIEIKTCLITTQPSGLRIAFFGTPAFAAYILEYLKEAGENIVVVVTTPEKQQGRGLK